MGTRRDRGIGRSAAVNELVRAGISRPAVRGGPPLPTHALGARIDLDNIAEALEVVEGTGAR
ncbi:MAG: hypothetical protein ACRDNS_11650 [Trebonia sp.]